MVQKKYNHGYTYQIRLRGVLNHSFPHWFGDITVLPQENGEILVVGQFSDQPALRGLLDQLWDLNYTLISLQQIETVKHLVWPLEEGEP